jgi:hypothetical protein
MLDVLLPVLTGLGLFFLSSLTLGMIKLSRRADDNLPRPPSRRPI